MKKVEVKKMQELKLRQLHRGFLLTDFDNNEVGCKDFEQALEEIKKLIKPDGKFEESIAENPTLEKPITERSTTENQIVENHVVKKRAKRTRESTIELHRKIFEAAKEQINLLGRVNGAQIARDLNVNASNVGNHLKKMESELDELIKKWQDERDRKMVNAETKVDSSGDKPNG
jgi:hypothetical protein